MGGNIFDFTGPIEKKNIRPTLLRFFAQLTQIFPEASRFFTADSAKDSHITYLGSVGKKDVSGDIDLGLTGEAFKNLEDWGVKPQHVQHLFDDFKKKSRSATDDQLMKRAVIVAIARKIEESKKQIAVDVKGSGAGALFLAFPQFDTAGKRLDRSVQIDINVGDIDWLKFAYYSDTYQGNVKGLHRTQLMLSLFSNADYTFNHNSGVKEKETHKIVATNPAQAIDVLNKSYGFKLTSDILQNYFKLQEFLKNNLDQNTLSSIYDTFLKVLDSTRADIPEDLQQYWMDNQQRLGLKGKFLPDDSKLKTYAI